MIFSRYTMNCAAMERRNPNLVGGDINGGLADLRQLLGRPVFSACPYRVPVPGLYLCSSSTPPGGGVHGLCGYYAAEAVLRTIFGRHETSHHISHATENTSIANLDAEEEATNRDLGTTATRGELAQ